MKGTQVRQSSMIKIGHDYFDQRRVANLRAASSFSIPCTARDSLQHYSAMANKCASECKCCTVDMRVINGNVHEAN